MNATFPQAPGTVAIAFRVAVLIAASIVGVIALVACAQLAQAATLKPSVVLMGEKLTAGDLFDGLPADKAAYVLGPAPQAGQEMVLNSRTLIRVASVLNIDWKPASAADQIIVRANATVIDKSAITAMIEERLKESNIQGKYTVGFAGGTPQLVLPKGTPATAEISAFTYNPSTDRFEATIVGPSRANLAASTQVIGYVERTVSLPVLKKAVRNGDIIHATDVDWVEISGRNQQADFIAEADQLIGKTARRMVTAGKPVRANEVENAKLVSRGGSVTIVYENGPITVTAKGKALEDGGMGSTIRVVNIASNRSIDAVVNEEGIVKVD